MDFAAIVEAFTSLIGFLTKPGIMDQIMKFIAFIEKIA